MVRSSLLVLLLVLAMETERLRITINKEIAEAEEGKTAVCLLSSWTSSWTITGLAYDVLLCRDVKDEDVMKQKMDSELESYYASNGATMQQAEAAPQPAQPEANMNPTEQN